MSVGTQHDGHCYSTQLEAAKSWCSAYINGRSDGSVATCDGIVSGADSVLGDAVTFTWTRRVVAGDGSVSTSSIAGQKLPDCETYGWDYYEPIVAAWFGAMVAVVAVKSVHRWVFARESV